MASGVRRQVRGSFAGTGSAIDISTVGFRPNRVRLLNVTGLATLEWTESMADAAGLKEVTDGTKSFITSNGVTPLAAGFRLGADGDMNVSTEVVHYIAEE